MENGANVLVGNKNKCSFDRERPGGSFLNSEKLWIGSSGVKEEPRSGNKLSYNSHSGATKRAAERPLDPRCSPFGQTRSGQTRIIKNLTRKRNLKNTRSLRVSNV
jgi:hypothetical protein